MSEKVKLCANVVGQLSSIISKWPVDKNDVKQIVGILDSFIGGLSSFDAAENICEIKKVANFNTEDVSKYLKGILTIKATTIKRLVNFYENYSKLLPNLQNNIKEFLSDVKNTDFTIEILRSQDPEIIIKAIKEASNNNLDINRVNGRRIFDLFENLKKLNFNVLEAQTKFLIDEIDKTPHNHYKKVVPQLLTIINEIVINIVEKKIEEVT
ncbi:MULTISPECIES: hypothetical protein [Psychrilyobacter]|uniref:Uncharacterized protein n=1 Tax=Psychrilyobacter piezotolerans TaxID=2293438 RepID=A0ABX9KIZ8_9FUSO|nr:MULTISPECIES: hypothetical protein [Psychrilyobacter]MCS5422199.1 hypothetical protein [Psychrilyobacter sp. S5]NDI77154.1 hypothetical protein [Psychrilyobacter piezotolerans]RDE64146.1 hypothetical protein DV867_04245 [Psychrilyobacter sp. S5]REI42238.1 hypothetical protein DYH56_04245 [Psychrilyobacter piezotolerans]